MATMKIVVRLMDGETLCFTEADQEWTVAHLKCDILPKLPPGRFLKNLLLGSKELNVPAHKLCESGFSLECENLVSAVLQQGVPPGKYESECHDFGWTLNVRADSSFTFQKRKGDLKGPKMMGLLVGNMSFEPCEIEDALGVNISVTRFGDMSFSPCPVFYGAVRFPEEGKMILKCQQAVNVIRGFLEPAMPTNMEDEHGHDLVTYSRVSLEVDAESGGEPEEENQED
eukprot:TRINITY_DN15438_c0_g1_i1.p1 TRINITY_DN15438_c0_g1~~TRINITY_DN15438_c0_g1_i1.p1  ORF type:complete len:228 (+),score=30.99 TRINITY_DN15438_c0_g1_i1:82-765(+)